MLYDVREGSQRYGKMNVAYEMDFDIESFLTTMRREARAAGQRNAGTVTADRHRSNDRMSGDGEGGAGSERSSRRS